MEALLDPPPRNASIRPALRLPISNSINLPEINSKRT